METPKADFLDSKLASGTIAFLILFSVVSFSLETLPGLSPSFLAALEYSEIFIVAVFTAEYSWRLYRAESRIGFATSFYGLVDLLAILPFYLMLAFDLRALRLLRMLRLLRILKLARYNAALSRMKQALIQAKEELVISVVALGIVIYLAAFGIYQLEHAAQPEKFVTIVDALWWAVSTVTTVGYGDIYPITAGGRFLTFVILIVSLGLVAVPTGIFASALFSVRASPKAPEEGGGDKTEDGSYLTPPISKNK